MSKDVVALMINLPSGCFCNKEKKGTYHHTQSSQWPPLIRSSVHLQKLVSIWTWLNPQKCSRATDSLVFLRNGRWVVLMESPKMTSKTCNQSNSIMPPSFISSERFDWKPTISCVARGDTYVLSWFHTHHTVCLMCWTVFLCMPNWVQIPVGRNCACSSVLKAKHLMQQGITFIIPFRDNSAFKLTNTQKTLKKLCFTSCVPTNMHQQAWDDKLKQIHIDYCVTFQVKLLWHHSAHYSTKYSWSRLHRSIINYCLFLSDFKLAFIGVVFICVGTQHSFSCSSYERLQWSNWKERSLPMIIRPGILYEEEKCLQIFCSSSSQKSFVTYEFIIGWCCNGCCLVGTLVLGLFICPMFCNLKILSLRKEDKPYNVLAL